MNFYEFEKIFKEKEKEININIPDEKVEKFYKYMKGLIEWNEKINLTAITDEEEIIEKHFIDSLTILKYIKDDYTMIDVGTGAGFPGLPIAISSKAEVTLLDSLNKRVNFLNSISTELGLNNVNTIHGRAEEMGANQKYREKYDIAVSRAVAPMNVLVEYLLPFVKIGGICICMKGPKADEELKEAKRAIKLLGGEIIKQEKLKLDNEKMGRNLIIIKKVSTTAKKYPRKPGMPAKQPL